MLPETSILSISSLSMNQSVHMPISRKQKDVLCLDYMVEGTERLQIVQIVDAVVLFHWYLAYNQYYSRIRFAMHLLLFFASAFICLAQNHNGRLEDLNATQASRTSHRSSLLPTCMAVNDAFKSGAHPHQAELIRDLIQLEGQKIRRRMYWSELINALENPGNIEEAKKLYFQKLKASINFTNEEIRFNSKTAEDAVSTAKAKVESAIAKAVESNPSLAPFDSAKIRACVYGRSNPHLYEGRPKVSMMLQFFKRPWAVQSHIDKVMECQVRCMIATSSFPP